MNNLLDKAFSDLVFEERNKDFGAYFLRRIYDKHILIATLCAASVLSIALAIPFVNNKYLNPKEKIVIEQVQDIELEDIIIEEPVEETPPPPPPPPPPPVAEVPAIASVAFVEMEVKNDEQVKDTVIAKQKDFEDANPGEKTIEGKDKGIQPVDPEPEQPAPKELEDTKVYTWVEEAAAYQGGMQEMKKYLIGSLTGKYTKEAIDAGVSGKVVLEFVIEKDGSISEVKVLKGLGHGLDEVAIEAIQNMPAWQPAKQNQLPVRMKKQLAIPFQLIN